MFNIRDEGERIKQGFNFYPLSSRHNFGFILRVYNYELWIRYSMVVDKLYFRIYRSYK